MNLIALPAFTDNYIWMLHDGRQAIVVDPGEAAPVVDALASRDLSLVGILVTHHHNDHVGGVDALRTLLKGPVFGPAREAIPQPFIPLKHGDTAELLGMRFQVIDVPGHTSGHIAYFHAADAEGFDGMDGAVGHATDAAVDNVIGKRSTPILFCGDTLFSGGCGRLFEGTAAQMHDSLDRLAALPADTRVCCAHEFTLANLAFARAVEPANDALIDRTRWSVARREAGMPTLPSDIGIERAINPFLRCTEPAVVRSATAHGATGNRSVDVFAALRQWKNDFK